MAKVDNPAGRLHRILEDAAGHNESESTRKVWTEVLSANPRDPKELLHRFRQMLILYEETEAALKGLPDLDEGLYLSELKSLNKVLDVGHWHGTWGGAKRHLTPTAMLRLEFCADALARHYTEAPIDPDEVSALLQEADKVIASILRGKLPADVKATFVSLAELLRQALIEYQIRGAVILREILGRVVGAMIYDREKIEPHLKDPEVKKFGSLVARVDAVTRMALNLKALGEGVAEKAGPVLSLLG